MFTLYYCKLRYRSETPGKRPFAVIHIDHEYPILTTPMKIQYSFVVTDSLSKNVFIRAVRNTATVHMVRQLEDLILDYGAPERIISDRGLCLRSEKFREFWVKHGIHLTLNFVTHPQVQGQVERTNNTLLSVVQASLIEKQPLQ